MPPEIIASIAAGVVVFVICVSVLCYLKFRRKPALTLDASLEALERKEQSQTEANVRARSPSSAPPVVPVLSHEYEEFKVDSPPVRSISFVNLAQVLPKSQSETKLPIPLPPGDRRSLIVPPPGSSKPVGGIAAGLRPRNNTEPTRTPTKQLTVAFKPPPLPAEADAPPPPAPSKRLTSDPIKILVEGAQHAEDREPIKIQVDGPPAQEGEGRQSIKILVDGPIPAQEKHVEGLGTGSVATVEVRTDVPATLALEDPTPAVPHAPTNSDILSLPTCIVIPSLPAQDTLSTPATPSTPPATPSTPPADTLPAPTTDTVPTTETVPMTETTTAADAATPDTVEALPSIAPPPIAPPPAPPPKPPPILVPSSGSTIRSLSDSPRSPSSLSIDVRSRVRSFEARMDKPEQPGSPRGRALTGQPHHREDPWLQRANKQGRIYYFNVKTGESTWEKPN